MLRWLVFAFVASGHALVDFPQLPALVLQNTYNSTSCSHRCCRQAAVSKDPATVPACATDWTACAQLDPSSILAPCRASTPWTRCSVWVPCDPNPRIDFAVGLVALVLLCAAPLYLLYRYHSQIVWSYPVWIQVGVGVLNKVLCGWSLFYASDFLHWNASTEVLPKFLATQTCLETCTGSGCSFCGQDSDAIEFAQHIALFIAARAYLVWLGWLGMYSLLILSIDGHWYKGIYWYYGIVLALMQLAFLVCDSVFLSSLLNTPSLDALFVYATALPVTPTVAILLAFDLLDTAGAGVIWWWTEYANTQLLVTTPPKSALFHSVNIGEYRVPSRRCR